MLQAKLNLHERRGKHRLPFQRQVQIDSSVVGQLQVAGFDYSPSGISVFASEPLPAGEQLVLRFPVGRNQQTELEVAGKIIHHYRHGEGYIIGICFLEGLTPVLGALS